MINAIQIALSGLNAASQKASVAASNIANVDTTGSLTDPAHAPYTPVDTQQTTGPDGTVQSNLVARNPAFVPAYDPTSPFANSDGQVGVPNVDLATEAVNLDIAKITYAASAKVIKTESEMQDELLKMVDKTA
jgi:flagellar basal-body rod protein FlgC